MHVPLLQTHVLASPQCLSKILRCKGPKIVDTYCNRTTFILFYTISLLKFTFDIFYKYLSFLASKIITYKCMRQMIQFYNDPLFVCFFVKRECFVLIAIIVFFISSSGFYSIKVGLLFTSNLVDFYIEFIPHIYFVYLFDFLVCFYIPRWFANV